MSMLTNRYHYIVLSAIIVLLTGCGNDNKTYITEPVKRMDISKTVSLTGALEPVDTVVITAPMSEMISSITVQEGDMVSLDSTLMTLKNDTLENNISARNADVEQLRARLKTLLEGATKEDMDVSEVDIITAKMRVEQVETQIDSIKSRNEINKKNAINALEQAKIQLQQAEDEYDRAYGIRQLGAIEAAKTDNSSAQKIAEAARNSNNARESAMRSFVSSSDFINSILKEENTKVSDKLFYNVNFGDGNSAMTTKLTHDTEIKRLAFNRFMDSNPENEFIKYDNNTKKRYLNSLDTALQEMIDLLQQTRKVIDSTIPSYTIQPEYLSNLKDKVDMELQGIEASKAQITAAVEAINALEIGSDITSVRSTSTDYSYETALVRAKNGINTAKIQLQQAEENVINTDKNAMLEIESAIKSRDIAKNDEIRAIAMYNRTIAPARKSEIEGVMAQIKAAEILVEQAKIQASDATIKAPLSGVVRDIKYSVGERITMGTPILELATDAYIIRANVSETDLIGLSIGQKAVITFDAMPTEEVFNATLTGIDTQEKTIGGVIYYPIELTLESNNDALRSGMTANIDMIIDTKDSVLAIPPQAIKKKDGRTYTEIMNKNGKKEIVEERNITLGMEGDSAVEVINGLSENDIIIVFTEEKK